MAEPLPVPDLVAPAHARATTTTTDGSSTPPRLSPRQAAAAIDGAYCVVLRVDGEHVRRRLFFGLPAAQRAMHRAHQRGADAELVLCELRAVGVVA